jgi:hypothetical protein
MSRTYRRRGVNGALVLFLIDPRSKEGRRAIARFHSDAYWTLRSVAPRWYRRILDHRQRTLNTRQVRRWLADPGYDPVFDVRHRHSADGSWW